jgi:citrate lyase beta subunit
MPIRRALLFMPGDDRRKIEKGASSGVDSIIMDIEDGVALNRKTIARATVNAALSEVEFGRTERLVRINPVSAPLWEDDLTGTIDGRPDGYVLPKVESGDDVRRVSGWLAEAESARGWMVGALRLLVILETARGFVNLGSIAGSDARLDGLIFGAEDLAGDIGATRTPEGWEVFYARSALVIHAKACGLQAIDTPFVDLADLEGLTGQTRLALNMGYTGKLAIHPRQIEPIQQVFTPTGDEIRRARRLIQAHEIHQASGAGVFELDGKMVDMPMVRAAEAVLARARAAGIEMEP